MGLRDRMKATTAGLGQAVDERLKSTPEASDRKVTMPGQLGAFRLEAQGYIKQIEELKAQLEEAPLAKLPVAKLHEVPGRRRKLTAEQYAELKENIRIHGLDQPVIVERRADGEYDIVAGNNRTQVHRDLGIEEIGAIVRVYDSRRKAISTAFYSNLLAPSLPDYEKYLGFKALMEESGMNQQEAAQDAGVSASTVSRLMKFDDLPPEALAMIEQNPHRIGFNAVEKLAAAAQSGKKERVVEAIQKLVSDDKFTQESAIEFVNAKTEQSNQGSTQVKAAPTQIKHGRKVFCEVTVRSGTVGVKFKDAGLAERWKEKLEKFIRENMPESE